MLVLTRNLGEVIVIGHDIRIAITEIAHGRLKLGVSAPREIGVFREELFNPETIPAVTPSPEATAQHLCTHEAGLRCPALESTI